MHPPVEGVFANNLTNVLENKVIGTQISVSTKTKALFLCQKDCDGGILLALKALVLTFGSAFAIADAFDLCGSVDAVRLFTASVIRPSGRV